MSSSSTVRERFAAVRESDGLRGVLTLYASGSEPDGAIYDLLRKLPRNHVPEIFATGRWCDRAYEVVEEFIGGTLADLPPGCWKRPEAIRILVAELGQALHSLSEAGLRHRDLRPSTIFCAPGIPWISSSPASVRRAFRNSTLISPLRSRRRATWRPKRLPAVSHLPPTGGVWA